MDKHEYHAGEGFAMAGGSPRHSWIAGNVQSVLERRLDDRCFTFTSDQRIVFNDGKRYVYPDVSLRAPDRGWFYRTYGVGEQLALSGGVQLDIAAIAWLPRCGDRHVRYASRIS